MYHPHTKFQIAKIRQAELLRDAEVQRQLQQIQAGRPKPVTQMLVAVLVITAVVATLSLLFG
jgi:hypothetical protein